MKTFVQEGRAIRATAPYAVASGAGALIGGLFGVAGITIGSGVVGDFHLEGVFDLVKTTGTAWLEGQTIFWDNTNKKCITVAKGNIPIGIAVKNDADTMAASGDAIGRVRLMPGLRTVGFQHTTVAAADTVVTGLALVISAVATLDSDPGDDPEHVSVTLGDQAGTPAAGSIIVKTWKNGATDPTPAAATTFSKKVNVIAVGY